MKIKLSKIFALLIITTMIVTPVAAQSLNSQKTPTESKGPVEIQSEIANLEIGNRNATVIGEIKGAKDPAIYIIQLSAEPLASYRGGIPGLTASSPAATGASKLDVNSAASKAYRAYLADARQSFLTQVKQETGRSVKVLYTYDVAYNGMAVELTPEEAAQVAKLPGVLRVIRNYERYIQTDTSPEYLNAWGIWDGTNTGAKPGTMGEGMLVGIIDTGINMDHPSFADVGDDGYDHTNPLGTGVYTGWCNSSHPQYNASLVCNDKLIGVYSYPDSGNDPEDDHSHGSHTGSTTAGNIVFTPTLAAGVQFVQMSGMAPHANLISYDVCIGTGGCAGTSILAGIDDAVADGVDVINFSIGGGPSDPWNDPDSLAFLAARDAGVFVATSAGNSGPDAGTAGSPGNSPWLITVANGTHDRGFDLNGVVNMAGGTPPADIPGTGVSGEYGPARIVYAADYGNALCGTGTQANPGNPFAPGTWSGEIVVCDRGTYYLVDKAANVMEAGAGGIVIANTAATGSQTYATDLGMPGTHVTYDNGELLRVWLVDSDTTVYTATITASPVIHDPALGGILSASSSRGPNVNADILKPDIMAPGSNILAAYAGDADSFGLMSGTSMASPHVAGAATLLRAVHPTWTPAEVQSALMMTSWTQNLFKENGTTPADPFDVGAGRLDLTDAALAGLVLNETKANFEAADPATDGDPTTLNLASLASAACLQECSWDRTFRNTTGEAVTWEITFSGNVPLSADPITFTVAATATQMVNFTADVSGKPDGAWLFGTVILTPDDTELSALHLPVAVMPTSGVLPELVTINTRRNAGSQLIEDLQAIEITNLTVESFGLTQADLHDILLNQDPTRSDPYDDLDQVYVAAVTVPTGAKRLVAEVTASEAPDVDLFVLYNGAEVCKGGTPSWREYCNINDPVAGTYYIVVQNWQGSTNQPDAISMATAVVPGTDAGNMTVTGPTSVPEMTLFDLQLFWDIPTMEAGDHWYGAFSLGTDSSDPGNIGTIPVNLHRDADDVTKVASQKLVQPGDVVTYTITVMPNVTGVDLNYVLTDTIPAGLTYVPGSATASDGVVNVTGDTLTWEGIAKATPIGLVEVNKGGFFDISTFSLTYDLCFDLNIAQCDESYVTLTGMDFYYLEERYDQMTFTSNGFAVAGNVDLTGADLWDNQNLPNATIPNNTIAAWWTDLDLDGSHPSDPGGGHWYLNYNLTDSVYNYTVVQWQDAELFDDSSSTYTFQIWIVEGTDTIWFSYDTFIGDTSTASVGIENVDGTYGDTYYYNGNGTLPSVANDLLIAEVPTDPVTITYAVTVGDAAPGTVFTNAVEHQTDNPGSKIVTTSYDVYIGYQWFLPIIFK